METDKRSVHKIYTRTESKRQVSKQFVDDKKRICKDTVHTTKVLAKLFGEINKRLKSFVKMGYVLRSVFIA